jgi:hypothetical protein
MRSSAPNLADDGQQKINAGSVFLLKHHRADQGAMLQTYESQLTFLFLQASD